MAGSLGTHLALAVGLFLFAGYARDEPPNPVERLDIPDAMRAKVQGTVLVECPVTADGSVGDVQVRRSLDSTFGLDQEAVKAARQRRVRPATSN